MTATEFGCALVAGDAAGMAHATDPELMAHFCEYDLPYLVGAVAPRLVWEGARKAAMSTRDLARLAAENPMAVHDLMWS